MNNKNRLSLFVCLVLAIGSTTASAYCTNNGKNQIQATTINKHSWKQINDHYSSPKQAIFFHDDSGGLIKLKAGYKHPVHHYNKKIGILIIDGDLNITLNDKTTTYSKGSYITIPAKTCFNSSSDKGALIAIFGVKPGESNKNN